MIHRALSILFCVIVVVLSSCSTAKWVERPIDGPWVAPGVHAREFERVHHGTYGDTIDLAWTNANGRKKDAIEILESVRKPLKELGEHEQWPDSNSNVNGYQQRLAPYTFHIVAIEPTIVIMVPHDFGDPTRLGNLFDFVGEEPKQSSRSPYMLNYIEYGTTMPYHPDIRWLSPDMGTAPATLKHLSDSEQEIHHKRIKLVTKREGDRWTTRREPP